MDIIRTVYYIHSPRRAKKNFCCFICVSYGPYTLLQNDSFFYIYCSNDAFTLQCFWDITILQCFTWLLWPWDVLRFWYDSWNYGFHIHVYTHRDKYVLYFWRYISQKDLQGYLGDIRWFLHLLERNVAAVVVNRWAFFVHASANTCFVSTSLRASTCFQTVALSTTISRLTAPFSWVVCRRQTGCRVASVVPRRRRLSAVSRIFTPSRRRRRPTCPNRSDRAGSGFRDVSVQSTWTVIAGGCRSVRVMFQLNTVTTSSKDVTVCSPSTYLYIPSKSIEDFGYFRVLTDM